MRALIGISLCFLWGLTPAQDSLYFKTGEAIGIRSFTLNPASITYKSNADAVLEYSKTLLVKLKHGDSLIDFVALVPKNLRIIDEDSEDFVKSCRHNAKGQLSASEINTAQYIYTNDPNTADRLYREIKKTRSKRTQVTVFSALAVVLFAEAYFILQAGIHGTSETGFVMANVAASLSVVNLVSKHRHKKHIQAIIHNYIIPTS